MAEQAGTLQNSGILVLGRRRFVLDLLMPSVKIYWKSKYEGTTILTQPVINGVISGILLNCSKLQCLHSWHS